MEYTKEQINEFNKLVEDTLKRGTIRNEDKKKLEAFLTYVTGQNFTGKCVGCLLPQILNILKAYRDKIEKEKTTTSVTEPVVQSSNVVSDTTTNNNTLQDSKPKNKGGRPAKDKTAQL